MLSLWTKNAWTNKIKSGQFHQFWTIHPWTNYFRTIYPWGQSMHGQIKLSQDKLSLGTKNAQQLENLINGQL